DKPVIRKWAEDIEAPTIILGSARYLPLAREIATALAARRKKAEILFVNEVAGLRFDFPFGQGGAQVRFPGPGVKIPGTAILLGTAADNALIDLVMNKEGLTLHPLTARYPGPGRGLIEGAWRVFSTRHNAVLLTGSDAAGAELAAQHFARFLLAR
ncbi:MAG: hypothetical protein V1918_02615, partial [Planctomycetota bacterium]